MGVKKRKHAKKVQIMCIHLYFKNCFVAIVGNKCDMALEREVIKIIFVGICLHNEHILTNFHYFLKVPSTVGMLFAQKHGCVFYEISAKTSKNLTYFFNYFFSKWFCNSFSINFMIFCWFLKDVFFKILSICFRLTCCLRRLSFFINFRRRHNSNVQ